MASVKQLHEVLGPSVRLHHNQFKQPQKHLAKEAHNLSQTNFNSSNNNKIHTLNLSKGMGEVKVSSNNNNFKASKLRVKEWVEVNHNHSSLKGKINSQTN